MATSSLNNNLINELLRLCLLKKSVLDKIKEHLKYQYLPSPEYKKIYQDITNYYSLNNNLPTFGVLYEINKEDPKTITLLSKIKECDIVDTEPILRQLEIFIKDVRFQILWDQVIEKHSKGEKEDAIQLMSKESTNIAEFSIFKNNGVFLQVFKDFQKIQLEKQLRHESGLDSVQKIPFGILPCDIISQGGIDRKETVLWIMRSGVGKSTVLKWQGMYACRLGFNVLHIQLEGAEEEAFDKYTQVWAALNYHPVRTGNIGNSEYNRLLTIAQDMVALQQDVTIKAYEQFGEVSMLDVRDCILDYIKDKGFAPDMLILDSVDLVHPGDGLKYGVDTQSIKMKLQNSSRKLKNLCNEFNMRGVTATQTSDVPFVIWNDPDKVITRSDSMGDKSIANSYSYVLTGNQTMAEEKENHLRIYFDKVRYYDKGERTYPIVTNFGIGRFYNAEKTKKTFGDVYKPR